MMSRSELNVTKHMCKEMVKRIDALLTELDDARGPHAMPPFRPGEGGKLINHVVIGTAKSGAVRRQSMDLTRQLAELRKP
jgi:hypothetical protein